MSIVAGLSKKPVGSSPGSVVYVGKEKTSPISISRIRYGLDSFEPSQIISPAECRPEPGQKGVVWYTIDGVHQVESLKTIGDNFKLHPLVVEDIVNTTQRPKIEDFGDYLFVAVKMITYNSDARSIQANRANTL